MGGVPEDVEGGDLVGEELDGEEQGGDGDDPGVGERVETGWELHVLEAREETEGRDGSVDVESGGEGGGDDESGDGGWGEGHGARGDRDDGIADEGAVG